MYLSDREPAAIRMMYCGPEFQSTFMEAIYEHVHPATSHGAKPASYYCNKVLCHYYVIAQSARLPSVMQRKLHTALKSATTDAGSARCTATLAG